MRTVVPFARESGGLTITLSVSRKARNHFNLGAVVLPDHDRYQFHSAALADHAGTWRPSARNSKRVHRKHHRPEPSEASVKWTPGERSRQKFSAGIIHVDLGQQRAQSGIDRFRALRAMVPTNCRFGYSASVKCATTPGVADRGIVLRDVHKRAQCFRRGQREQLLRHAVVARVDQRPGYRYCAW